MPYLTNEFSEEDDLGYLQIQNLQIIKQAKKSVFTLQELSEM